MKRCTGCDRLLSTDAFPRSRARADGLYSRCRDCLRAYYVAYRGRILARKAAYRAANPDLIRAERARYRDAHRPELKARRAAYRAANRERILAQQAAYRRRKKAEGSGAAA